MQAVVTGASGLLGGNLAIELLKQGHQVRATRRPSSRVDHLREFDLEWVDGDLEDERALAAAVADADVVFHCAATVSTRKAVTPVLSATNVDGTRTLVEAVGAAQGVRLVHCSTVAAIGLSTDGRPCTEDARWSFAEHGLENGYVTTKRQAENVVREAAASGVDAVIVNPTYMLGPYDRRPSSGALILKTVQSQLPGYLPGYNNFVDVRDVARGMILACERGRAGERYILGGENLSYRELGERIARVAGVGAPRWPVPRTVATLIGLGGDLLEWFGSEPLLNSVTVRYGFTDRFQFSSEKAERELGYQHGPVETAISDAIAWFRQSGML